MQHIPVFLIGLFLALIGLEVMVAPDAIIVTPAHQIVFNTFGRLPLGLALLISGAIMGYEGWRGSKSYHGAFLGIFNALFWLIVTLTPAWAGNQEVTVWGFTIDGAINSVSTLVWLLVSSLCFYYYVTLRRRLR